MLCIKSQLYNCSNPHNYLCLPKSQPKQNNMLLLGFQFLCHDGFHGESRGYNFSSDLLPSLGAHINQSVKLRRFVISPFDPHYRAWQMFLIPLVIYSAWICPFELAFLRYLLAKLLWIDNILNSFFAIDIVLTFFVACLDRKSYILIDDPKRIAVRYLSSGFIFDLLSTAPFRGDGDDFGFKILNMLRLWRLRRKLKLQQGLAAGVVEEEHGSYSVNQSLVSSKESYKVQRETSNSTDSSNMEMTRRKVVLHRLSRKITRSSKEDIGKLINLPDSLENLFKIASEKFSNHHPIKVLNLDNVEVDDISVIRDGDHLFLAEEDGHCV